MGLLRALALAGFFAILSSATPQAQTYNWSVSATSGSGSGSGTFSVTSGVITGITGSFSNFGNPLFNGTIGSLFAVNGYAQNDNVYNVTAPYLTYFGVAFTVGGNPFSIYYFADTSSYFYSYWIGGTEFYAEVSMGEGVSVSASNTLIALANDALVFQNILDRQLLYFAMMANYDCSSFDKDGICVSFNVRRSSSGSTDEGAGILTAAYRIDTNYRVGAFIEYTANEDYPAGLLLSNQSPTVGAFIGYSQHSDPTGLQGKIIAASGKSEAIIERSGDANMGIESGSGKTNLNSYMVSGELGWGIATADSVIATPYVSIRFIDVMREAYSESTSDTVTLPISYNSFYQNLTTATFGVRLNAMMTKDIGYQVNVGIEHDLYRRASAFSGASDISGLEDFSLNTAEANNRTRGIGSIGIYYQTEPMMRLSTNVSIQNQAFSNQTAVSAMIGYQVAF